MEASNPSNPKFFSGTLNFGLRSYGRFVIWILAVIVIVGVLLYANASSFVRNKVHEKLNEHFAPMGVRVDVGNVEISSDTIVVRDIALSEITDADHRFLSVDKALFDCELSLEKLWANDVDLTRITLQGVKLNLVRKSQNWNVEKLLNVSNPNNQPMPELVIKDGEINVTVENETPVTVHQFDATVRNRRVPAKSKSGARVAVDAIEVAIELRSNQVGYLKAKCHYVPKANQWAVSGVSENIIISPDLLVLVPEAMSEKVEPLMALRGKIDCHFSATGFTDNRKPIRFSTNGYVKEANVTDPRLPYPIQDLRANFDISEKRIEVSDIVAQSSIGEIRLDLIKESATFEGPWRLNATMDQLQINRKIADSIPESAKIHWDRFDPAGLVNLDLDLIYDGGEWRPDLRMELIDVSFAYYKFPYRLERAKGMVRISKESCSVDIQAMAAGAVFKCKGAFKNPGPAMTGAVEIESLGDIPIDQKMMRALSANPKVYKSVSSFRPKGMLSVKGVFGRQAARDGSILNKSNYTLSIRDGSVLYEKLPYPVHGIHGTIRVVDDVVKFENLEGSNDGGYIRCNGVWGKRTGLDVEFLCSEIKLEDELQLALSDQLQDFWTNLQPNGTIDQASVVVKRSPNQSKSSYDIWIEKWSRSKNRTKLSLRPSWFPYDLTDVNGSVHYKDGVVTLQDISGSHGETRVMFGGDGYCDSKKWSVRLNHFMFEGLVVDRQFISALPKQLSTAVESLDIDGIVNVDGQLTVLSSPRPARISNFADRNSSNSNQSSYVAQASYLAAGAAAPATHLNLDPSKKADPEFHWNVKVDLAAGALNVGVPLRHVYGGVQLIGAKTVDGFASYGSLDIDTMVYNGFRVTNVSGPLSMDSRRIIVGQNAIVPVQPGDTIKPVLGNFYGGVLDLDAHLILSSEMPFQVRMGVQNSRLSQIVADQVPQMKNLSGNTNADLNLTGNQLGSHTYRGKGSVRISDGKISEVPALVAVLKTFHGKKIDRTAFDRSNIEFKIEGDQFYFEPMEFIGDAVSLQGKGTMGFDHKLNLDFVPVGKHSKDIPVFGKVFGAASQELVTITVTGSLDNPQVEQESFPGIKDSLKKIFPGPSDPDAAPKRPGIFRPFNTANKR